MYKSVTFYILYTDTHTYAFIYICTFSPWVRFCRFGVLIAVNTRINKYILFINEFCQKQCFQCVLSGQSSWCNYDNLLSIAWAIVRSASVGEKLWNLLSNMLSLEGRNPVSFMRIFSALLRKKEHFPIFLKTETKLSQQKHPKTYQTHNSQNPESPY